MRRSGRQAADQVEDEEANVPDRLLDVVAEDPEEQHVAAEMRPAAMQEHRREERRPERQRDVRREVVARRVLLRHHAPGRDEGLQRALGRLTELQEEGGDVRRDHRERDNGRRPAGVSVISDRNHAHLAIRRCSSNPDAKSGACRKLRHLREVFVKRFLSLVILLVFSGSASAQPEAPPRHWQPAIAEIDALVAGELAKDGVGSVTIGIVSGPKLVWTKSYGMADNGEKARGDARVGVPHRLDHQAVHGADAAAARGAGQGPLERSDRQVRAEFQPAALFPGMPVPTLVELATMTSGVAREPTGPADHSVGPVSGWQEKVFLSLPFVKYAHEPDTKYLYSNIGYATLGVALSRAAGQPFTTWVEQKILAPLGMARTAFDANDADAAAPDARLRDRARRQDRRRGLGPRARGPRLPRAERRPLQHRRRPGALRLLGARLRSRRASSSGRRSRPTTRI
jgi:hypothetical protein